MAVKVFTLEEANRLLPKIEPEIRFLAQAIPAIQKLKDQIAVLLLIGGDKETRPEYGEFQKKKKRVEDLVKQYNRRLNGLQGMGCIVKDLRQGLVDFYGVKEDRLIFLCWKVGEETIEYWHELHAGFRGRRPVAEL